MKHIITDNRKKLAAKVEIEVICSLGSELK